MGGVWVVFEAMLRRPTTCSARAITISDFSVVEFCPPPVTLRKVLVPDFEAVGNNPWNVTSSKSAASSCVSSGGECLRVVFDGGV